MIQLRPPATPPTPVPARAAGHPAGAAALSWLEIHLNRVAANAAALRSGLGGSSEIGDRRPAPAAPTRLCAVLKKNAYGLGAGPIARQLADAGCDMLAVYAPEEAAAVIEAAPSLPVLLLMPVDRLDDEALRQHAVEGNVHLTVHRPDQLRQLNALGQRLGAPLPLHLFLDTGMSRSGLSPAELRRTLEELAELSFVSCVGVCSHLACAEDDPTFTEQQRQRFATLVDEAQPALPPPAARPLVRHLANTFATLRDPRLHLDMVRCGLGLLGYGPESMRDIRPGSLPPLAPVVRWLSRIIHLQRYEAGASVGYGATHTLARQSLLGIVPVGYGDGYPLALSNRAVVRLIDDHDRAVAECPVVGRVNMDQIVIDLTDAPAATDELFARRIEVISDDPAAPNALPRLAEAAGLHAHAMLCQLSPLLPRRYVNA